VCLNVQPLRPFSACEPSTADTESARSCIGSSLIYPHGFLDCLTPMLYVMQRNWPDDKVFRSSALSGEWAGGKEAMLDSKQVVRECEGARPGPSRNALRCGGRSSSSKLDVPSPSTSPCSSSARVENSWFIFDRETLHGFHHASRSKCLYRRRTRIRGIRGPR
jgi:hypothetical protein